jgi:lipopolysaccharide biosynthesis protein
MISLEDDIAQSMERALILNAFLNSLSAPTPAQLWLERTAAELERQRDPDGAKKATRSQTIAKLFQRDGHDCWFCARPLGEDISIEHIQPRALGGTWNDDNLALAHVGCNKAAGHLSRIKKEALREEMQSRETRQQAAGDKHNG